MTKIYVILNTKTNEVKEVTEKQIEDRCCGYYFYDDNAYRESYETTLENLESEEEKEDFIKYWECRNIFDTKEEFIKELVEDATWTSPNGIISEYRVLEIKEA